MLTIDRSGLSPLTHTLSNGQPLHLFQDTAIEIVKIDITFEAGPCYQDKKLVAVTTNKLLTEGTLRHSAAEIAQFMDFRGIIIDTTVNSFIASVTAYALRRHVTELIPMLHEILTQPAFAQHEFQIAMARRRQQLLTSLQKTSILSHHIFYRELFGPDHILGNWAVSDDTYNITIDDIRNFFRDHYQLGTARYIISGHYDDTILRCFDDYFGHAPAAPRRELPTIPVPVRQPSVFSATLPNAVQSSLRIGRILPVPHASNEFSQFIVLNTLLGGYFGSRLMNNLREDKGYTYGIHSQTRLIRGAIIFSVSTDVRAADTQAALREIYREMQRLCDEPVPDQELELVRSYLAGDFLRAIDGIFERAERFHLIDTNGIDENFTDRALDTLESVTPQQLQALARSLLQRDRMTQVVVGPESPQPATIID